MSKIQKRLNEGFSLFVKEEPNPVLDAVAVITVIALVYSIPFIAQYLDEITL